MSDLQSGAPAADALNVGSQSVHSEQPQGEQPQQEALSDQEQQENLTKEEIKRINKLKLKVYGEEIEEDLPFDIEEDPEVVEYLTKQLQLAKAAQRAMNENSTFQKQVQEFLGSFKKDTKAALEQLGIDPKEFAAQVIEEEIKKQQMSPEERERQELQEKIRKLEEERKAEREEMERREYERLLQQEYEKVESQIQTALETSGLPKSRYAVKKVAEYLMIAAEKGVELSAMDVAPIVKEEIQKEMQELIAALGEDGAEEFIGKEIINKIRKKNLSRAKQAPTSIKSQIKDVADNSKISNEKQPEKISMKKFFGI
jgi:hypothetical protein